MAQEKNSPWKNIRRMSLVAAPVGQNLLPSQRRLGRGAYGSVYQVATPQGQQVAVKRNCKDKRTGFVGAIAEVSVSALCRGHPYIVKLLCLSYHPPYNCLVSPVRCAEDSSDELFFIYELVEGGDLQKLLEQRGTALSRLDIIHATFQMLMAVEFLHSKGVVHGDIKPSNFLYRYDDNGKLVVKLCDFGLARQVSHQGNMPVGISTPLYRAPEVCWLSLGYPTPAKNDSGNLIPGYVTIPGRPGLIQEEPWAVDYDQKIDCWSLGAVLYQMIVRETFITVTADDNEQILRQIYRKHPEPLSLDRLRQLLPDKSAAHYCFNANKRADWNPLLRNDADLRQIIIGLLQMDPVKRMSVKAALDGPYWTKWQSLRQEVHRSFPVQSAEPVYRIVYSNYTATLLNYLIQIIMENMTKYWLTDAVMFTTVNLIYHLTAEISGDTDALVPEAGLHCYILLYLAIKYNSGLNCNPSWDDVVGVNYREAKIVAAAQIKEREILRLLNFQSYTLTPYDAATGKLSYEEMSTVLNYMLKNPLALNGKTPSQVLADALDSTGAAIINLEKKIAALKIDEQVVR